GAEAPSESVPYYLYCLRLRRLVLIVVNPLYNQYIKSLLALLVLSMPSNTVRCNEPFSGSMVGNIFDISKIKSSSINIPSLYWDETL
ncbi:hypothetical protein LN386_23470, partial [Enterobacter hormaechei subsp. steigerwaltii]|nr:hypothetical protein [Enterobacter hormaechei subsp. steigerwaltii]